MPTDIQKLEQLIEIITHEVLAASAEAEQRNQIPADHECKFNCADGLCVKTCFDRAGNVVGAGAERISSTIGVIPQDLNYARLIDHTLLKAGCYS